MNIYILSFLIFGLIACQNSSSSSKTNKNIQEVVTDSSNYKKYTFLQKDGQKAYEYIIKDSTLLTSSSQNIMYYFERLPPILIYNKKQDKKYFHLKEHSARITHQNVQNGYIKLLSVEKTDELIQQSYQTDYYEIEVALFKNTKQDDIIAINNLNTGNIHILILKNYIWQDITPKIFPDFSCKTPPCGGGPIRFFKLPEYGTDILTTVDGNFIIPSPTQSFWKSKRQNHSEEIIKIDWDAQKGKFFIKK